MKALYRLLSLLFFLLFMWGCQINSGNNEEVNALSDSVSITGLSPDSVKLVKTAGISIKVTDVEQSTRAISVLASQSGGMIFHQSFRSGETDRKELKIAADSLLVITTFAPGAELTIRVPSTELERFLYSVSDLANQTQSRNLHIEDKSLAFLENELRQKNRAAVLSNRSIDNRASLSNLKTIEVKDQAIDQYISNLAINADAAYSSINLSLFQNPIVRREIIANYNISDYALPFGQRLAHSLNDGWQQFLSVILALAHVWVFILLVLAGIIFYKKWEQKNTYKVHP